MLRTISIQPADGTARQRYAGFIRQCQAPDGTYRLTPLAEPTAYALCFAIFGLQLVGERESLLSRADELDKLLREGLRRVREERERTTSLNRDKAYLQLLTFTLSSLAVLGTLRRDPLEQEVRKLLPAVIAPELEAAGCLEGRPRSGNHAMFLGILLLHARDYLGIDTQSQIDQWVDVHLSRVNANGFWGRKRSMSHLQFQNGYHQYELLEYLGCTHAPWGTAAQRVASLSDWEGHFAPYLGGGGCYDYDAVFMLTATTGAEHRALLEKIHGTLLAEQNADGGFCESHRVRPRSVEYFRLWLRHVAAARGEARKERLRWGATLLRSRHDRIHTHWSRYSRRWNESNLWDSWFRMLAVARIEVALGASQASDWGFIDYPGIGFHHALHSGGH